MKTERLATRLSTAILIGTTLLLAGTGTASAADEGAARGLARQSNCFKCHSVDKKKEGPAWRDVAAKYRDKPDAEAKLTKHVTSGEKVKFEDGHEEDHAIVKSTDPKEIKNLVDWILSLH
ncbi:MAG TPA: c-type cytochrome [Steroidobacteraceae bacterium]